MDSNREQALETTFSSQLSKKAGKNSQNKRTIPHTLVLKNKAQAKNPMYQALSISDSEGIFLNLSLKSTSRPKGK